jgi:hypothetical protein
MLLTRNKPHHKSLSKQVEQRKTTTTVKQITCVHKAQQMMASKKEKRLDTSSSN